MIHKFRINKNTHSNEPRRTFAVRESSPTTIEVCGSALSSLNRI